MEMRVADAEVDACMSFCVERRVLGHLLWICVQLYMTSSKRRLPIPLFYSISDQCSLISQSKPHAFHFRLDEI